MTVECAWCGRRLGEKDGGGAAGTTSGICGDCFELMCAQIVRADELGTTAPEQSASVSSPARPG